MSTITLEQIAAMSEYEVRNGFPEQPVRCHHLKALGRSPAHAKLCLRGVETKPTPEMVIGSAVHAIIEGRKDVVVFQGKTRQGADWEKFKEKHGGGLIVSKKEWATAEGIAAALLADPESRPLVKARGVKREETIIFDLNGRKCRATADLLLPKKWPAEIKTGKCSDPEVFKWDAARRGYHVQQWLQVEAMKAKYGACETAWIIAVDNTPPYNVSVIERSEEWAELGERQGRLWLERFMVCEKAGFWPGYVQTKVKMPPLKRQYDDPEDENEDDAQDEAEAFA